MPKEALRRCPVPKNKNVQARHSCIGAFHQAALSQAGQRNWQAAQTLPQAQPRFSGRVHRHSSLLIVADCRHGGYRAPKT
jgi:hypothetical protein